MVRNATGLVRSPHCGPPTSSRFMPNLRVCHIGFNFFPGQGLTVFYESARHQARDGLEVVAIAPGRRGEPVFEITDGVQVHRVPLESIGRFSVGRLRFLWRASRLMRVQTFDVVHTYAFVGAGLLRLITWGTGACWLYDCQTSAIKPPLLGLQNWLIRFESNFFDGISVLSKGIRDIVFGANEPVDAIVPLGADLERFQPREPDPALRRRYNFSETDCVFCYCGTLDHNRKMNKLVDAFALVAGHESAARLLVIGDGTGLDDLKQQACELKLENRIVFTGLVPYAEVPAHLAITTIALAFVSMEPCFEHQPPTKTVEYLAQGLPVIATDTAGNRQFIRHDLNGLLSDDGAESYGHSMLGLMRDTGRRVRLAANARDSVKVLDWREIVRMQVIPLYRRLLRIRRLARYE